MKTLNDFYRLFPNAPVLADQPVQAAATPALEAVATPSPVRIASRYRQRDFGTGYGRSSGYGRDDSYALARTDGLVRVC
ncbi:MAG TPA: hypothetical protein VFQ84_03515 [Arenimonas sp.]|uniref:hypothetical protein n=1 Tax=Arenimonas sp. TaxID=1872635 RepID=UPI002D7EC467|nr:hypothetical protein [Arenimonas sp.]HEU0152397.1 hypothetical protein [Arenimonas sp.]